MEHNVVGVLIKHFIKKLLCVCSSDLQILIMTISLEEKKMKSLPEKELLCIKLQSEHYHNKNSWLKSTQNVSNLRQLNRFLLLGHQVLISPSQGWDNLTTPLLRNNRL